MADPYRSLHLFGGNLWMHCLLYFFCQLELFFIVSHPPSHLRFHCVEECRDWTQDCRKVSLAVNTNHQATSHPRIHLIHTRLHLIHYAILSSSLCWISSTLGQISTTVSKLSSTMLRYCTSHSHNFTCHPQYRLHLIHPRLHSIHARLHLIHTSLKSHPRKLA